jgi:hypothetical protein
MVATRHLVTIAALTLAACATTGNTPLQDRTYAAWATCQAEGHDARGSVKLERVEADGRPRFWMTGDGMAGWQEVRQCMAEQMAKIPLPASLSVSPSKSSVMSGLVVSEPPVWVRGDEWEFRSDSRIARSTYVWTVDREEVIDGVAHYVIKSGSREIFYRKRDIATSHETVNGAVVARWTPARVRYVWPLSIGLTWEQTFRSERPRDRQTFDRIDTATVEAEETITVPAGTFKTLRIVYRFKETGAISYEEWYSPDARMWVRVRERLETGPRVRELTAYRPASRTAAIR